MIDWMLFLECFMIGMVYSTTLFLVYNRGVINGLLEAKDIMYKAIEEASK